MIKEKTSHPSQANGIEWFSGGHGALTNTTISIARDGRFRCNAGFIHARKLQSYTGVEVGYDRSRRRILIRFVKLAKHAVGIQLHDHDGGRVANAKAFFTAHGLDPRRLIHRYVPTSVGDHGRPTFAITLQASSEKRRP
jgi:hypothetical protein